MTANTAAGTSLYIGTTASVAATDTYQLVGEVVNIPEYGRQYNVVKHNPLSTRGTLKVKGSYDDGEISVELAKDASDLGQQALITALDADLDYNFKIVFNDAVAAVAATVTVTIAAPGIFTDTAHGLAVNTPVKFTTTGALPTGITAGTTYYVKTVVDANSYSVSATAGGSAITTTGTQSGVHTRTTVPASTFDLMKAKVTSYTTNVGTIDSIVGTKAMLTIKSGSIAETNRIPLS
jgi:hypothetical protein